MNDQAANVAVAEFCGIDVKDGWFATYTSPKFGDKVWAPLNELPDYGRDLNAMHEAEKMLNESEKFIFVTHLSDVLLKVTEKKPWWLGPTRFETIHATASQRREALLRTIGKWEDGE